MLFPRTKGQFLARLLTRVGAIYTACLVGAGSAGHCVWTSGVLYKDKALERDGDSEEGNEKKPQRICCLVCSALPILAAAVWTSPAIMALFSTGVRPQRRTSRLFRRGKWPARNEIYPKNDHCSGRWPMRRNPRRSCGRRHRDNAISRVYMIAGLTRASLVLGATTGALWAPRLMPIALAHGGHISGPSGRFGAKSTPARTTTRRLQYNGINPSSCPSDAT